MTDPSEGEAFALLAIQRALDDAWPDGRRRLRLKRVMTERVDRMRRLTGYQTLDALRAGDPARYDRFLTGSVRAMVRDGLINDGQLGPTELARMREAYETRGLHEAFNDDAERRYG